MSKVDIDNLYCDCDKKYGIGELDIKRREYTCFRCGEALKDNGEN